MNKKYALFGAAAAIAIAGVIYFGTGANQQASVANLTNNSKLVSKPTPTFPTTEWKVGTVTKEAYAKAQAVAASENKSVVTNPAEKKVKFVNTGEGVCYIHSGGVLLAIWEC